MILLIFTHNYSIKEPVSGDEPNTGQVGVQYGCKIGDQVLRTKQSKSPLLYIQYLVFQFIESILNVTFYA